MLQKGVFRRYRRRAIEKYSWVTAPKTPCFLPPPIISDIKPTFKNIEKGAIANKQENLR